jgi:hypothetical protein
MDNGSLYFRRTRLRPPTRSVKLLECHDTPSWDIRAEVPVTHSRQERAQRRGDGTSCLAPSCALRTLHNPYYPLPMASFTFPIPATGCFTNERINRYES